MTGDEPYHARWPHPLHPRHRLASSSSASAGSRWIAETLDPCWARLAAAPDRNRQPNAPALALAFADRPN
jgi:hypothetical protein